MPPGGHDEAVCTFVGANAGQLSAAANRPYRTIVDTRLASASSKVCRLLGLEVYAAEHRTPTERQVCPATKPGGPGRTASNALREIW